MIETQKLDPDEALPLGSEGQKIARLIEAKNARFRAQHVKDIRVRAGLTQAEMAERLGVGRSALAMMETGRMGCSEMVLAAAKRVK